MAIRFTIFSARDSSSPSTITFDMSKVVVGRGSVCDLRLPHPSISFHHATVEVNGAHYSIRDEGSTNGTVVNGNRIPSNFKQRINSDDVIEIGTFKIVPTLSVPMNDTHSDERTETVARALMEDLTKTVEPARLLVTQGPDSGQELALPSDFTGRLVIGSDPEGDLPLTDPRVGRVKLGLSRGLRGWSFDCEGGDVKIDGVKKSSGRLSHGSAISIGSSVLTISDHIDEYYEQLLREPDDMPLEEELDSDLLPVAPPESEPRPPAPVIPRQPAAPEVDEKEVEEEITSRAESMNPRRAGTRLPEYSWMVVTIGVLAFLGSLALLLLLMF